MIRIWYRDSRRCEYGRAKIELQQLGVWIWVGCVMGGVEGTVRGAKCEYVEW